MKQVMSPQRRDFLQKGAMAAAATAALPLIGSSLVGCSDTTTTPTDDTKARDIALLTDAYMVEMLTINTYASIAASGIFSGGNAAYLALTEASRADHVMHAAAVKAVITADLAGTAPVDPAASETLVTGVTVSGTTKFKNPPVFGDLLTIGGTLKYAVAMELYSALRYFSMASSANIPERLTNASAVRLAADITPVDTQHAAVLRAALKLVIGSDTDRDDPSSRGASISPTSALSLETPRW